MLARPRIGRAFHAVLLEKHPELEGFSPAELWAWFLENWDEILRILIALLGLI